MKKNLNFLIKKNKTLIKFGNKFFKIKRENFEKEFFSLLKTKKIDIKEIKKVNISKEKDGSYLNERLAYVFKNFLKFLINSKIKI